MKQFFLAVVLIGLATTYSCAKNKQDCSSDYLSKRWKDVATRMPSEWYGSDEAKLVAENVLLSQKEIGGWEKNKDYHKEFSNSEQAHYMNDKSKPGATFDNGSTITELKFLAKVYAQIHDDRYKLAFEKGLNYIFIAQYENGGWPQYFPVKDAADEIRIDKTVPYSMHITYNDNAMVNTMRFLKEIYAAYPAYAALELSNEKQAEAQIAFDMGVQCILNTQIIVDGKPTVWCAQHDEITLAPANARSYELASFSGSESVDIVQLLMNIKNPSEDIIASVDGAVLWFENNKIEGIKIERIVNEDGQKDRAVVEDINATTLWGRFYDLETSKPFFCSRDGIKRNSLAEISHNRRNGYSWYTSSPSGLLEDYPKWLAKNKLSTSGSQQLAFPSAEGYGKYTVGGRGGAVYEVTNLNDSGEGSLRAAVEASGARTVVFRVSGTIELESDISINNSHLTIAGQTAPGDGICLRKYPININADQVIIRHMRVRVGNESGDDTDAVSSRYCSNIIVDHVSASWSIDETMSIYHCDSITVQWSLISESMFNSNHIKGNHGFGGIWGSNNSSYHHNLIAHHGSRNPRFASGCGNTDYRNNVLYNWGYQSSYGGEKVQKGSSEFISSTINMVANYYKAGPATAPGEVSHRIVNPSSRDGAADHGKWFVADNVVEGNASVSADNWNGGVQLKGGEQMIELIKLDQPWPAMAIKQQTAEEAYTSVLENAGATLPKRDPIDTRIIDETKGGYASFEGSTYKQEKSVSDPSKICGIIDSQADVGGWPVLNSIPALADNDHDGMPNKWEKKNGLNPNNADDRNKLAEDGYTMLEKYLNSIN